MFRSEIERLSEILDEHIEKGMAKARKRSKIERYEEELNKALSHDPFRPVTVDYDSPYYSPYKVAPEGGYLPYTADHWSAQGKDRDAYLTTDQFYERYGAVEQAARAFRGFAKALERGDLVKAGAVPVGTVHTYADGQKYKKIAEGKWVPVVGLETKKHAKYLAHKDPKVQQKAHQMVEDHAMQTQTINEHIKRKESELRTTQEVKTQVTKEVLGHMKKLMAQVFDGPMPDKVQKVFEQAEKKGKITPEHHLKEMSKEMSAGKTHDVHVRFNLNGAPYEHVFKQVQGTTMSDAQERVVNAVKKKFGGGVKFERVSVRRPQEGGDKPKQNQNQGAQAPEKSGEA